MTDTIRLADVADALAARGIHTTGEHTGGGVFCLYAGPTHTDGMLETRHAAAIGPAHLDTTADAVVFDLADCYVGADDEGGAAVALSDVGALTADHAAAIVAAQVALAERSHYRSLTDDEARAALPTVPETGGTDLTGHERHAPAFVASCRDCFRA